METATKHVQFVLETVVDQDARATVVSFATELKRAQDSLTGFTTATTASLANANRDVAATLHQLATSRENLARSTADQITRLEDVLARHIQERSQQTTNAVLDDIDERVRAEEDAQRRVRNMPAPVPVPSRGGLGGTGVDDDQRRRAEAYEDANLRIIKSEGLMVTAVAQSAGISAQAYQSMQGQIRNIRREMFATAAEASGSLMQVARGFMALGLASEQDLEKVARGLVKIQSMFDIVSGSTRVMLALEKVMHSYRQAAELATVAQEALNASQIRSQMIGSTGFIAGLSNIAGGLAGRARALFTTRAAAEAAEAAATAQAMRQGAMLGTSAAAGVSAPAAVAAGAAAGGAGGAAVMGIPAAQATFGGAALGGTAVGGIVAATLASLGFAGSMAVGTGNAARQNGFRGGAAPGTWTDYIGGASMNPFGWMPESMGGGLESRLAARAAAQKTEKMETSSSSFQKMNTEDFARMEQSGAALQASLLAARESSNSLFRNSLEGLKTEEKRAAIVNRLADTEAESSRLKAEAATIESQYTAEKAINEAATRAARAEEIDLLNQQVAIERQIGEEKKAAARERLATENESLSKMEAQLKLSKDQLLSARERFAMMNEGDQMAVNQLAKKLKDGADLSSEELGRLSSFRELGGIKDAYDAQLDRRAQRGGFDQTFGEGAKAAIDAAEEKTKAQREIVAALKTEITVTIEADTKKITDELTKKIGDKLKTLDYEIRASVGKLEAEVTDIKQRIINRANGGI